MAKHPEYGWVPTDDPCVDRIVNLTKGPQVGDTFVRVLPPDADLDDEDDDEGDDDDPDDNEQPRPPAGAGALQPIERIGDAEPAVGTHQ